MGNSNEQKHKLYMSLSDETAQAFEVGIRQRRAETRENEQERTRTAFTCARGWNLSSTSCCQRFLFRLRQHHRCSRTGCRQDHRQPHLVLVHGAHGRTPLDRVRTCGWWTRSSWGWYCTEEWTQERGGRPGYQATVSTVVGQCCQPRGSRSCAKTTGLHLGIVTGVSLFPNAPGTTSPVHRGSKNSGDGNTWNCHMRLLIQQRHLVAPGPRAIQFAPPFVESKKVVGSGGHTPAPRSLAKPLALGPIEALFGPEVLYWIG